MSFTLVAKAERSPEMCPLLAETREALRCRLQLGNRWLQKGFTDSALVVIQRMQPYTGNFPDMEAERLYLASLLYHGKSSYDSSFEASKAAAEAFLKLEKIPEACKAYNAAGNALRESGKLKSATEFFYKAIELAEKTGADSLNADVYLNLSVIFLYLKDYEKHDAYVLKAYANAKKYNNLTSIGKTSMGLVQIYRNRNQTDSAEYFAKQALASSIELDNQQMVGYAYLNLALIAQERGLWEQGNDFFLKIIDNERIPAFDRARFLYFYGNFLMEQNAPTEAKSRYEAGYALATELHAINLQHSIASRLVHAYEALRDYPNAYRTAMNYIELHDSIYRAESEERIQSLNAKYETAEKERELQAKRIEVIQRTNQRNSLIAIAVGLLFLGGVTVFGQRRRILLAQQLNRQQAEIAEQKIRQLQQEQKYLAFKSMVAGEEAERSRLAKELHDGLGSMLSNLKLTFSSQVKAADEPVYQEAITIVDRASTELRRIAQNMMPESLTRFGLISALEDLAGEVQQYSGLETNFQHFDVEEPLPNSIMLPIYRIVQELLNNTIKHAQANEVIIQLIQRDAMLFLTVEDNGVGIQWNKAVHKGGFGLKNIQSRVTYLNGKLNVESSAKAGTSFNIEIPIPKEHDTVIHN